MGPPPFSYSPNGQTNVSQQVFQPAPPTMQHVLSQVMATQPPNQQFPPFCFQPLPQSPVSTQYNPCPYSQGTQSNDAQGFLFSPTSRTDFSQPPPGLSTFNTPHNSYTRTNADHNQAH